MLAPVSDSLPERDPRLDRVARVAAMAMISPIVIVSLFSADDDAPPRIAGLFGIESETALAMSAQLGAGLLCHTLAVDDARLDTRFHYSVADCKVVAAAYCNKPLLDSGGDVIGSLCVIDTRPRQWAVQEIETMQDMALLTVDALAKGQSNETPPVVEKNLESELPPPFLSTMPTWFIEHAAMGLAVVDLNRSCLWANAAFEEMLGIPMSAMLGSSVTELIKPLQEKGDIESAINQVLQGGKVQTVEIRVASNESGPERFMGATIYPVEHEGQISGASVFMTEVSDRRKSERDRRLAEDRLALACEAANVGVWYWDLSGDKIEWTSECSEIFGLNAMEGLDYASFIAMLHPEDREATDQAVQDALAGRADYHVTYRIFLTDGQMRWIDARGRIFTNSVGEASYFMGAVVDVTGVKQKEFTLEAKSEALLTLNDNLAELVDMRTAELQFLSQSLIELAEKEKAELARELHDELGAHLTVANMEVAAALRSIPEPRDSDLAQHLMRARETIHETTMLKRRVVEGLRPSLIESLGLAEALRALVTQYAAAASHIQCKSNIPEDIPGLRNDMSVALYRIAQESLTNIAKYANADEVYISLERSGDSVVLEICDNGTGLPEDFRERATAHGISGMQQRAAYFKGVFSIMRRTDGPGTRVTAVMPMPSPSTTVL